MMTQPKNVQEEPTRSSRGGVASPGDASCTLLGKSRARRIVTLMRSFEKKGLDIRDLVARAKLPARSSSLK